MKVFKISLKNHFKNASLIIFTSLISLFFPYAMSLIKNENVSSFLDISIFNFCLLAISALIIPINYYLVNRGDVLEYADQEKEITIYHKEVRTNFSLDNIDYVQCSMS